MISPNGIRAVFFDLDGTLRHSVPSGGDVFTDHVVTLGLRVGTEDRLRAVRWEHFYWANSADLRDDLLAHSGETETFWIEYSRRRLVALGAAPEWAAETAPRVSAHMGEFYKPESIVTDDARRVLLLLQRAGYVMAVISNRDKSFQETLEKLGIASFFAFSLAGGEVNAFKPHPEIFEHALRRVHVTASEAVYVGDNYFADVVGSRRAGLTPVLYDPQGVFPEAGCPVITSFDDLPEVLKML